MCSRSDAPPKLNHGDLNEDSGSSRGLRAFWIGQGISYFGDQLLPFALTWWAVTHTDSAVAVSFVSLIMAITSAITAPCAGILVDILNHKKLMIATVIVYILIVLISGSAMLLDRVSLVALYAIAFAVAALDQPYLLLQQVLLRELVSPDGLSRANGRLETIRAVVGILSPAFAGYIAAQAIGLLFWVNAITFGVLLLSLLCIEVANVETRGTRARHSLKEALVFLGHTPHLLGLTFLTAVVSLTLAPLGFLVPLAVKQDFALGSAAAGLSSSAFAVGVLTMSGLLSVFGTSRRVGSLLGISIILLGLGNILFGFSPVFASALFGSFLAGAGTIATTIFARTLYQRDVPITLLGRVTALRQSLTFVIRPAGILLGGGLAESFGPKASIAGMGCAMTMLGIVALCSRTLRRA